MNFLAEGCSCQHSLPSSSEYIHRLIFRDGSVAVRKCHQYFGIESTSPGANSPTNPRALANFGNLPRSGHSGSMRLAQRWEWMNSGYRYSCWSGANTMTFFLPMIWAFRLSYGSPWIEDF